MVDNRIMTSIDRSVAQNGRALVPYWASRGWWFESAQIFIRGSIVNLCLVWLYVFRAFLFIYFYSNKENREREILFRAYFASCNVNMG